MMIAPITLHAESLHLWSETNHWRWTQTNSGD